DCLEVAGSPKSAPRFHVDQSRLIAHGCLASNEDGAAAFGQRHQVDPEPNLLLSPRERRIRVDRLSGFDIDDVDVEWTISSGLFGVRDAARPAGMRIKAK